MKTFQLREMDFFELKLLHKKKGVFYVRNGETFLYQGTDKIMVPAESAAVPSDTELESDETLDDFLERMDIKRDQIFIAGADVRVEGYFHLSQFDEYYMLIFVTPNPKANKNNLIVLRCGNALDSL